MIITLAIYCLNLVSSYAKPCTTYLVVFVCLGNRDFLLQLFWYVLVCLMIVSVFISATTHHTATVYIHIILCHMLPQ